MQDDITISGIIGTDPRHVTTATGLEVTSFRLATTRSRFDAAKNDWVRDESNWYSVVAYGALASTAAHALHKKDRVILHGRVRTQENRDDSGRVFKQMDVVADVIGRDIRPGRAASATGTLAGGAEDSEDRELQPVGWAAPGSDGPDVPF